MLRRTDVSSSVLLFKKKKHKLKLIMRQKIQPTQIQGHYIKLTFKNTNVIKDQKKQSDKLKETKEMHQLNTTCDPVPGSRPGN